MKTFALVMGMVVSVSAFANEVVCEAVKDEQLVPGVTLRGVSVFVQTYETNKKGQIVPGARISEQSRWFFDDKSRRDQAGPKCWKAIQDSFCSNGPELTSYGRGGYSVKHYDGANLKKPDGSTEHFSDAVTSFGDSAMEKCLAAQVQLGINAMQAEYTSAKPINAKAFKDAHDKAYQEAFDRASKGNANNR